jgi:hypothetical protein
VPWSWSFLVLVLVAGSAVVVGRVRAIERERTRLVAAVQAVRALAVAHRGLAAAHRALADDLRHGRPA